MVEVIDQPSFLPNDVSFYDTREITFSAGGRDRVVLLNG
jgi:hypothetical protein